MAHVPRIVFPSLSSLEECTPDTLPCTHPDFRRGVWMASMSREEAEETHRVTAEVFDVIQRLLKEKSGQSTRASSSTQYARRPRYRTQVPHSPSWRPSFFFPSATSPPSTPIVTPFEQDIFPLRFRTASPSHHQRTQNHHDDDYTGYPLISLNKNSELKISLFLEDANCTENALGLVF